MHHKSTRSSFNFNKTTEDNKKNIIENENNGQKQFE